MSVELLYVSSFLGAALSVGIASVTSGIGTGYIAGEANAALMRQPKSYDNLFRSMLIGQAATGTGGIFSLVIALLLLYGGVVSPEGGWFSFAAMLGSALAIGIGCIGPVYGAGYCGGEACKSIGRMPRHANTIMGNMLIGQALAQTSAIFALLISLLLLYSTPDQTPDLSVNLVIMRSVALFAAGIVMGLGTIGPGIGIGNVTGKANDMLGRYPTEKMKIIRTMFLGAAVSQSTAIYALIIAFLLMYAI